MASFGVAAWNHRVFDFFWYRFYQGFENHQGLLEKRFVELIVRVFYFWVK
jgi:hypothetical protein